MVGFDHGRRRILVLCAAALLPAAWRPAVASAQQPTTTLVGSVRDSAGGAVPGVELRIAGHDDLRVRSNEAGGFRLASVPVGRITVSVRRLGFSPFSTDVTLRAGRVDSLVLSLTTVAASLEGVVVEDEATSRSKRMLAGFWERRSHGFGSYLTRDQIVARHAANFVDLVRLIPAAVVANVNGRPSIRFKRFPGQRDCPPQYWVDGLRIEQGQPDEFTPEDVEAVEIYAGPATIPVEFGPRPTSYTCGAIVIWTRVPGA